MSTERIYYRGKPLDEMSREELIAAITALLERAPE